MAARQGGTSPDIPGAGEAAAHAPGAGAAPAGAAAPVERLRVASGTIVALVGVVIGASLVVSVVSSATRVLGWLLAAALLAALLDPVAARLERFVPRPLAVLAVLLAVLGVTVVTGYGVIDELGREFRRIQRAAPAAARTIEQSGRFGSAAREFKLAERTQRFVNELPARLQGGSGTDLLRTNATRSVAFLAGGVLTAFLLVHGRRLAASALAQIDDEQRRRRVTGVLARGYRRARLYVAGRLVCSLAVGVVAGTAAWVGDVPGPRVLGLFAGVWSLVPTVGLLVGALPIIVLAGGTPGGISSLWMLVFFVAAQIGDALVTHRLVERRTVHVGPFVSLLAGMLGFELYGIGGALAALPLAVFGLAVADELAPPDGPSSERVDALG